MTEGRISALEVEVRNLKAELDKMSAKVDDIHTVLLGARAIKWFVLMVAGILGFFGGDKIAHWLGKL